VTKPSEQQHVVVIGMHRSGTSAVADAVARLGLALPDETDLITPGPYNERGYWESRRFVTYNDRILKYLGGTWSSPPLPPRGWEVSREAEVVELKSGARDFALREFTQAHMVLKDPRLCHVLPLWREVFDRPPVAVLVLRDPLEVARSLEHRNDFPVSFGLALWRRYVQQSVTSVEGLAVFVADYQAILSDPHTTIRALSEFLADQGVAPSAHERIEEAVAAFEPELRHHRTDDQAIRQTEQQLVAEQQRFAKALVSHRGGHAQWNPPELPEEPSWVGDFIELSADGEMVAFARAAAEKELKWIKRSRLFGATKTFWRITSSGPTLSPDPQSETAEPLAPGTSPPTLDRLRALSTTARRAISGRSRPASEPDHIAHEDNPAHPARLRDFQLFAVIKTWMDEDIIEATVRAATAQGADAVYLVDNASTDATVSTAEAAGATIAEVYQTEAFDGRLVQPLVNAVVARESLRSGADHVWWMLLDSDEFPEGPSGTTVKEYLATLDRKFRLVGATFLNHLPDGKPEYVPGFHPLDFQPLHYTFEPLNYPPCPLGHWKHPLQRFDRHGQFLLSNDGAHTAFASEQLVEPSTGIVVHHFQYRDEATTRAKLELVESEGRDGLHESAGWRSFARRRQSLEAVYTQKWDEVDTLPNKLAGSSRHPVPWTDLGSTRRWYPQDTATSVRNGAGRPLD
jgi:Glycosyl transferase family 2